ncbi:MAG: superoxide dismutase [Planctomycetota bacterium]
MTNESNRTDRPATADWTRRAVLAGAAVGVAGTASIALARDGHLDARTDLGWDAQSRTYRLPDLPYAHDALEPVIDEQTMRLHHGKHHAGYVRGLNNALERLSAIRAGEEDAKLVQHWSRQLAFHSGGHINHAIFWRCMAPPAQARATRPSEPLMRMINRDFGSLDGLRTHLVAAAASVEASGWGWLVYEPIADRLLVTQMEKQQDLQTPGATPLCGVDVWEHAYYLKYQNRRRDYVEAFWTIINWDWVSQRFAVVRG